MELGEKLLRARQEAGLSQRQLCGEEITRNMLSQIEHGTARPSMGTLQYLAARLGKPVSYFLEEDGALSPNRQGMEQARRQFDGGNYALALDALESFRAPDEVYDRERRLLEVLTRLALARSALEAGREVYARELLEGTVTEGCYCREDLERRRLMLLGRLRDEDLGPLCEKLPSLDEELLLRGEAALKAGEPEKAARLLDAAEGRTPRWQLLRGRAHMARKEYREAAACFHAAEEAFPRETAPFLEQCYRELEDFRRAYFYACRQRE